MQSIHLFKKHFIVAFEVLYTYLHPHRSTSGHCKQRKGGGHCNDGQYRVGDFLKPPRVASQRYHGLLRRYGHERSHSCQRFWSHYFARNGCATTPLLFVYVRLPHCACVAEWGSPALSRALTKHHADIVKMADRAVDENSRVMVAEKTPWLGTRSKRATHISTTKVRKELGVVGT